MSFAVELKFLVRHDRNDRDDPTMRPFVPHLPAETRNSMSQSEIQLWQHHWEVVAQGLNSISDIKALDGHHIQDQGLEYTDYWKTHWIVYKSNSAVPSFVKYQNDDPCLPLFETGIPDCDKYIWIPVEVCSPVLQWPAGEGTHTGKEERGLPVLRNVLETINGGKCGAVFANHSTETHIHIGRTDGRFLSLATLKRLATLTWLSEPILRGVKDPKSPNFEHVYTWSSPLRRYSRLGMVLRGREEIRTTPHCDHDTFDDQILSNTDCKAFNIFVAGVNRALDAKQTITAPKCEGDGILTLLNSLDRRALSMIWRARTHQELGKMMSGTERKYRRLGFNFHSLEQDAEDNGSITKPRTVEFRFLEGFIDTKTVLAWARLCGEMAALAAEQVDSGEFYAIVAALLLILAGDSALDIKFSDFMQEMGEDRIPRSMWESLRTVIRNNYPQDEVKVQLT